MRTTRFITCLALLMTAAGTAQAQQAHVTGGAELNAAVVERSDATDRDRQELRSLLQREDVRRLATERGIDMSRVDGAVGTLGASDLQRIAPLVQQVNGQLVGGQTISIGATTLIIVLLIVLLIVVLS